MNRTIETKHDTEITGTDLAAVFSVNDYHVANRYFIGPNLLKRIDNIATKETRIRLINEFNSNITKHHDDHKAIKLDPHANPHEYFEPLQVTKSDNMVVLSGLTKMAEILTNNSNTFFTYLEVGRSSLAVDLLHLSLADPVYRVNVQDLGWIEPHGAKILTGSMFPPDMTSATIREIGCFDGPTDPSTMFWKVVIDQEDKVLYHTEGQTYVTVSHQHTLKGK